jgi:D-alanyl-lipoteichoic acid acyltransferase DltB (MBOAT superfamily)
LNLKPENKGFMQLLAPSVFKYDPEHPLIFSTAAFWLFFLVVLAGYSLIYKRMVLRNGYLFLFSLFFYYKSGGLFLFLLIFVTVIDFTCGLLIHNSEKRIIRRFIIVVSIISNLGILAYFKYSAFFVSFLNSLLGTEFKVHDFLAEFSNSLLNPTI